MSRSAIAVLACVLAAVPACERAPTQAPEPVATAGEQPFEVAPTAGSTAAPTADGPRPDVLLVIVDTLRADRLPAYGFAWGKTPTLDRLARESVVFDRAIAASAATVPSHASMFTSRFVRQHAVGHSNGGTVLSDEATIAEQFRDAGYATAGFIGNVMLNRFTGLGRGFDVWNDRLPKEEVNRPGFFERDAPLTTRAAISWLQETEDEPVFLLVHYQDPHGPYTPPDRVMRALSPPTVEDEPRLPVNPTQSGFGGLPAYQALEGLDRPSQYEARYVAEILFMDRWMGRLLDAFDEHRPDAGHIVLFTSDHGESLGEEGHWFAHGHTSMPDLAGVPFLLRAPGIEPGRRSDPVSHVDIFPTLLELAGVPVPEGVSGIPLGPYLREAAPLPSRPLYMDLGVETGVYDAEGMTRIRFPSLEAGAAGDTSGADVELYRWTDGGALAEAGQAADLDEATTSYLTNVAPMKPLVVEPDEAQVERLRALGYIDPEGPEDGGD